eukprot:3012-Heterococcus_DN1.PRE.1
MSTTSASSDSEGYIPRDTAWLCNVLMLATDRCSTVQQPQQTGSHAAANCCVTASAQLKYARSAVFAQRNTKGCSTLHRHYPVQSVCDEQYTAA